MQNSLDRMLIETEAPADRYHGGHGSEKKESQTTCHVMIPCLIVC